MLCKVAFLSAQNAPILSDYFTLIFGKQTYLFCYFSQKVAIFARKCSTIVLQKMPTFKAEVYEHHRRGDGTYNIKIRVTHNRKKRYLATPWYVTREDLTRGFKLKNTRYIDATDELIKRYRTTCNALGETLLSLDVDKVVELIKIRADEVFKLDVIAYTRSHIKQLEDEGNPGNALGYKTMLRSLTRYIGRDSLDIGEITVSFLNGWIKWIAENRRGGSTAFCRSQGVYLAKLSAIYNRAKREYNDEEGGLIRIPHSPFKRVELPKMPPTKKRALSVEQLRTFAKMPYLRWKNAVLAKDVFFLSLFLLGTNAADLFTATKYSRGRLTYNRQKTYRRREDAAEISIKIEDEARSLFEKYRDETGERVFKFYKLFPSGDAFNSALSFGMRKIGQALGYDGLTFYAARHSWATIAVNDAAVDKYTVHSALNHVDAQTKITDVYIKKSWVTIDKANRRVLDLLKLEFPQKI